MVDASIELARQQQATADALEKKQPTGDGPSVRTVQDNSLFTNGSEPTSTDISRTNSSKGELISFTPKVVNTTLNNSTKQEERKE